MKPATAASTLALLVLVLCARIAHGTVVWRFQVAYKLYGASPDNVTTVLNGLTKLAAGAPPGAQPIDTYLAGPSLTPGLPGPSTNPNFTDADIAGYRDFSTLDSLAGYISWSGQQAGFSAILPYLETSSRTIFTYQTPVAPSPAVSKGTYRYQFQWLLPNTTCGIVQSNVAQLVVAAWTNLTQTSPTPPKAFAIGADAGLGPMLNQTLASSFWTIAGFMDFNSSANMTSFLTWLGNEADYTYGLAETSKNLNLGYQIK